MIVFHGINDDLYKIKFIILTIFRLNSQLSLIPLDSAIILTRELQNRLQQRFFQLHMVRQLTKMTWIIRLICDSY
jgi:hypothetical protein